MYVLNMPKTRPANAGEMVDFIIGTAIRLNASDVHLAINQAGQPAYLLRFRIHGKLQAAKTDFIGQAYKEIISRIKVMGGMDITETKAPQDGQVQVQVPEGILVLRISTVPSADTEDVVIRLQKSWNRNFSLESVHMPADILAQITSLIHQKSGLITVNGPAGSGKTTTIYSILGVLAGPDRKIITAEDPIETRIPFVSHSQVSGKTNYAALCRAFMRQDADVIFVGEVRDQESAEAAIQLAQTGHLVLTTLHTRDSVGAINRLKSFEIHPHMIASTLIASLSQRLVPALCPNCKVASVPDGETIRRLEKVLPPPKSIQFYKTGPGCPNCTQGVGGRIPIFELLTIDAEIGEMIDLRKSKLEILRFAKSKGMKTLAQSAAAAVYAGKVDLKTVHSFVFSVDNLEEPSPVDHD